MYCLFQVVDFVNEGLATIHDSVVVLALIDADVHERAQLIHCETDLVHFLLHRLCQVLDGVHRRRDVACHDFSNALTTAIGYEGVGLLHPGGSS